MTFIVTLIALLIERFFDWSHLREWHWYTFYQRASMQRLSGISPYLILLVMIVPLLLLLVLIGWIVSGWLYGFVTLVFDIVVLLYCLGPQNLWADAFACISALQGDARTAAEKLKMSFGITDTSYSQSLHRHLLNNLFIEANRRIFAVVFWFVLLGPVGALLYRTVSVTSAEVPDQEGAPKWFRQARSVEAVLDWLPLRILTFIFALGGHFVQVLTCWRKKAGLRLSSNETLLTECGIAALGCEEKGKMPEDGSAEKSAVSLIDRAWVIALVMIAIASWVV